MLVNTHCLMSEVLRYIAYIALNTLNTVQKQWAEMCVCMFFSHLWHLYTIFDSIVEKVSASQNFLWIENRLNIKTVISQNMCVCSFPIFDIFDIHSITALRYISFIFNIFNIDNITFKENENDISDIFNMSHTLYSVWITM